MKTSKSNPKDSELKPCHYCETSGTGGVPAGESPDSDVRCCDDAAKVAAGKDCPECHAPLPSCGECGWPNINGA